MTDPDPALAALFANVRAAPGDDAPRLALADELTRRVDPRGEFIALQYRSRGGGASRKDAARERALLKASGRAWAGALGPLLADGAFRFERGFLAECRLKAPTHEQLRALADSDAWATVESLSLAPWASPRRLPAYEQSVAAAAEILTGDKVPSLRRASVHAAAVLTRIARSPRPLPFEELECSGWFHLWCGGFELSAGDVALLGATRALPKLRRLAVSTHGHGADQGRGPARFEALLRGPTFAQLEHFGLTDVGDALPAWVDALSALPAPSRSFEVVLGAGCRLQRKGLTIRFARDASGRLSQLAVESHPDAWEHQGWIFQRAARVLAPLDRALRAGASLTVHPGRRPIDDVALVPLRAALAR
ncbi:MAG: TIGR02996 domain-containing protein [Polyangiales bacterium]